MGKWDPWAYDKHYWRRWADHNREYWKDLSRLNQRYWNNPQVHHYTRHWGRGRMLGKIIVFGLGFWAGAFVNQRYRMPSAHPREAWEEMKNATDKLRKDYPNFRDSPELRELIEKVKNLEKSYRKQQPGGETLPSTAEPTTSKPSE